jgi:hypothetical protein
VLTTYSQGKVRYDDRIHAMVGVPPAAVCQAGLMIARIAGRFESDDPRACARCVAATEHPADSGGGPAREQGTDLSVHLDIVVETDADDDDQD